MFFHKFPSRNAKCVLPRTASQTSSEACQNILVHFHIYKNAGTSIDYSLSRSFGASSTTFEPKDVAGVLDAHGLALFLADRPAIRAVSSHIEVPYLRLAHCMPIIMLRHPIERARSVFQFDRRDVTQHNHAAARGSFAEYVDWALDAPDGQIRNYQVYHLSDAPIRSNNIRYGSLSEDLARFGSFSYPAAPSAWCASLRRLATNWKPATAQFFRNCGFCGFLERLA